MWTSTTIFTHVFGQLGFEGDDPQEVKEEFVIGAEVELYILFKVFISKNIAAVN